MKKEIFVKFVWWNFHPDIEDKRWRRSAKYSSLLLEVV